MGVSFVICLCLCLILFVGWQWYFEATSGRQALMEAAKKAEARAQDLAKMGLPAVVPKMIQDAAPPKGPQPLSAAVDMAVGSTGATSVLPTRLHPEASHVRSVPLQESSAEVVDALALLERYWKTASWKERISLVREPSRVAPLMVDYYERQKGKDPTHGTLITKARYQIDGTEILYLSYISSRPLGSLEVALLRGEDGRFLLDWESLVGYGEKSFEELREERTTKPTLLRAYVRLFEYYNFDYSDSHRYLCVKMTSESGENSIYGYCERSSDLGRWLEKDLARTGPSGLKGYTVRVSFPANAHSNHCVNLDSVIASRWLLLP